MKRIIEDQIGFADGEILSYFREASNLNVILTAWNETKVSVSFYETIGIEDYGLGEISEFVCEDAQTPLFQRAIDYNYEVPTTTLNFYSFQFLDLDGCPRLEIIAERFEISY